MSGPVNTHLSTLFGSQVLSDCLVKFYPENAELAPFWQGCGQASAPSDSAAEPAPKRQRTDDSPSTSLKLVCVKIATGDAGSTVEPSGGDHASGRLVTVTLAPVFGDPLPAHLLVVYCGCSRFRAQVDRWQQEKGPAGSKPVLRVPLRSADEMPHALAAIRFMYTGAVPADSASDLLHIRRQAAYLQVEGCVEACDKALLDRVKVLAGVAELYSCRQLLPDPEQTEEPNGAQILNDLIKACRQQLAQYSNSSKDAPAGGPNLGELLAWSFRDAPSVLSDPETRRQMEALPAAAMEALLGSEHFATDDEATVLLMLARWLEVNTGTSGEVRERLCRLVRLSSTYLQAVLPLLPWFPLSSEEHRFLCIYTTAEEGQRERMASAAAGIHDCSSPWYSAPVRPPLPPSAANRSYDWYITETDLAAALAQNPCCSVDGSFSNGSSRVAAFGFEWHACLEHEKGSQKAGLFLFCSLPESLNAFGSVTSAINPGPACLVAFNCGEDGRLEEAWSMGYSDVFVEIGHGRGVSGALQLTAPPAEGQQQPSSGAAAGSGSLLAPWSAYLQDGKLQGVLEWS